MNNEWYSDFDPERFLELTSDGKRRVEYENGEVVFSQGEPADAVFYIQNGQVVIKVVSDQGKEAIIAHIEAGSFFGETCLAGQNLRVSSAETTMKSDIMRLSKSTILQVIHDEPEFAEKFIWHLLARNIRVQADLVDQLFNSSEKRLARVLLLMANFGQEGSTNLIFPQISQENLAQMIGTTRSRVSSFMNKFRDLGFIDYNGGIRIHNSLLNIVLHDDFKE